MDNTMEDNIFMYEIKQQISSVSISIGTAAASVFILVAFFVFLGWPPSWIWGAAGATGMIFGGICFAILYYREVLATAVIEDSDEEPKISGLNYLPKILVTEDPGPQTAFSAMTEILGKENVSSGRIDLRQICVRVSRDERLSQKKLELKRDIISPKFVATRAYPQFCQALRIKKMARQIGNAWEFTPLFFERMLDICKEQKW